MTSSFPPVSILSDRCSEHRRWGVLRATAGQLDIADESELRQAHDERAAISAQR
jgi:hypothetical protein